MSSSNDPNDANVDDDDDDNRTDLRLLQARRESPSPWSNASSPSDTTVSSELSSDSNNNNNKIWPLQLKTVQVDQYVLGDLIGRGSYAEVRECIHRKSLERCAVKIVDKNYLKRQAPQALANQEQEIRLLRLFKHENIIKLCGVMRRGHKIYIVLEHCTYGLSDLLKDQPGGRLCLALAKNLFQQLCNGLEHLHLSLGVVHRDIKPQNLLITTMGQLKIIDFGVSQLLSVWTQNDLCKSHEGSPLFQAPELLCPNKDLNYCGFKVDVWAAGVTLYLMLYGKCPFYDESLLALYDRILGEHFEIPAQLAIPKYQIVITDLLAQMLDKIAQRRASIDQVLRHPWLQLCSELEFYAHNESSDCFDEHSELIQEPSDRTTSESSLSSNDNNYSFYGENLPESNRPARDRYRSTTVLPYLYNLHFPHLRITPAAPCGASSAPTTATTTTIASSTSDSSTASNPHEIADDNPIEWGTEQQFRLLKLPLVRANRLWPQGRDPRRRHQSNHLRRHSF